MNTLTIAPIQKQMYQVQPEHSHPKLSLTRVLWVRFLRWIDKASPEAVWKAVRRSMALLLVSSLIAIPNLALGFLTAALQWNSFRIPIFLAGLYATLNAKRLLSLAKSARLKKRAGNQYTYNGVPSGELAAFLKQHGTFKREQASKAFGLSQGQYRAITEELEKQGVLFHGENNAFTLRPISLQNLVRQLTEDFPLIWDEEREIWVDRDGPFNRWVLSKEFERRKLSEETERAERRLDRTKKQIKKTHEEAASPFASVFAHSPITCQ